MFFFTTVLRKCMKSLRNYVHYLSDNAHAWSKIYTEFYHGIVYVANEGRHIRITTNFIILPGQK